MHNCSLRIYVSATISAFFQSRIHFNEISSTFNATVELTNLGQPEFGT